MKFKNTNKGLTLTELLIVISIIAFLAVLITSYLRTQLFKANDAKRKADLKRIGISVEEYEKDKNCYPTTVTCTTNTSLRPYLDKIPCDPVSKTSYSYESESSTCPKWYRIYADLENEKDVDYQVGIGPESAYSYYQSSPNAPVLSSDPIQKGTGFYGCFSGVCQEIPTGKVCTIKWQNNSCYKQCANPNNEC